MRVPTTLPQVAPDIRPAGRQPSAAASINPDAFGANIGRATAGVGQQLEVQAAKLKDKQDTAAVMGAINEFSALTGDYLHNTEKGLYRQQGAGAAGAADKFGQYYDKEFGRIRAGLSQDQQLVFDRHFTGERAAIIGDVSAWEAKQADVALQQNAAARVGILANEYSKDGAWQNAQKFDFDRESYRTMLAATMPGATKEVVQAAYLGEIGKVHVAVVNNMVAKNDVDGVLAYIGRYGGEMGDNKTKALAWATDKKQDTALTLEADRRLQRHGNNLQAAIEELKAGGKLDESKLAFSAADKPDWQGVTAKAKAGTVQLWSDLSSLGIQAQITSGKRDKGDSSYHNTGNGVDIFLGDAAGNRLAADDPRVQQAVAKAKANGWGEVLYHDAGSGLHLHLGDYKGNYTGAMSDADRLKMEQVLTQRYRVWKERDDIVKHDELVRVRNAVATASTMDAKIELIKNSGLEPYLKADLEKSITTSQKSNPGAVFQLHGAYVNGTLSLADVRAAMPYLNAEDQLKWAEKAQELAAGRTNKDTSSADKKLKEDVEAAFDSASDKEIRQQLVLEISERLDRENVKGWQRYTRGKEMLTEAGVIIDGKGKSMPAKAVIKYGQTNTAQFGQIEQAFGADVVRLSIRGFVRDGMKNPDAWEVNQFLSSIGKQIEANDPAAQAALDWHVKNNVPLSAASYRDVYEKIANKGR